MSCPLQGIRFLDHPRLRGEHSVEKLKSSFDVGSPPPTRGTLKAWYKSSLTSGITPAYAGNTSPCPLYILKLWDHPRLRGEHSAYHHWPSFEIGSPPPTRGTLKSSRHRSISSGITPAYAGNTRQEAKKADEKKDHPRLRGEHFIPSKSTSPIAGSPPPTRGTPSASSLMSFVSRITPAYAGNTWSLLCATVFSQDHPRLRGEHL